MTTRLAGAVAPFVLEPEALDQTKVGIHYGGAAKNAVEAYFRLVARPARNLGRDPDKLIRWVNAHVPQITD